MGGGCGGTCLRRLSFACHELLDEGSDPTTPTHVSITSVMLCQLPGVLLELVADYAENTQLALTCQHLWHFLRSGVI